MKKQTKRTYQKPESKIVKMEVEHLLQTASGQHKHIGQSGQIGDAKRNNTDWDAWDDEDENENSDE
jgi:transposase